VENRDGGLRRERVAPFKPPGHTILFKERHPPGRPSVAIIRQGAYCNRTEYLWPDSGPLLKGRYELLLVSEGSWPVVQGPWPDRSSGTWAPSSFYHGRVWSPEALKLSRSCSGLSRRCRDRWLPGVNHTVVVRLVDGWPRGSSGEMLWGHPWRTGWGTAILALVRDGPRAFGVGLDRAAVASGSPSSRSLGLVSTKYTLYLSESWRIATPNQEESA